MMMSDYFGQDRDPLLEIQEQRSSSGDSLRLLLGDETRRERRAVLIASVIAVAIGAAEIVPTEITALGLKFSTGDRVRLLWIVGAIVLYLLISFLLHALVDAARWREMHKRYLSDLEGRLRGDESDIAGVRAQLERAESLLRRPSTIVIGIFEFVLPISVAIVAIAVLLTSQL
jgi:hypothetical protein